MRRAVILLALLAGSLLPVSPAWSDIPVTGRIELPNEAPAARVEVELLPQLGFYDFGLRILDGKGLPDPTATALTRDDGTFLLEAPGPGLWQLRVAPDGYRPMGLYLLPLLEARVVPTLVLTAERAVRIRLKGAGGVAPAGARVVAEPPAQPPRMSRDQEYWRPGLRRAFADETGVAILGRGPDEALHIYAFAPGHLEAELAGVNSRSVALPLTRPSTKSLRVESVRGEPVAQALVRMGERHWRVGLTDEQGLFQVPLPDSGELLFQSIDAAGRRIEALIDVEAWSAEEPWVLTLAEPMLWRGRVVDRESSRPVAGAFVWRAGQPFDSVRSDSSGSYALPGPSEGGMWIWAAAGGYLKNALRSESALDGAPTIPLQAALRAGGVVVDEDGRPVADVEIAAEVDLTTGGTTAWQASRQLDRTISDRHGRFSIGSLSPDASYYLRATKRGYGPGELQLPNPRNDSKSELELVLERGRAALGTVVDTSGVPIPGARIEISEAVATSSPRSVYMLMEGNPWVSETHSDPQGRFRFDNLRVGTFEIRVSAAGYAPTSLNSIDVLEEAPQTSIGEVTLQPGFAIEGRVVDSRGSGIAGAAVFASEAGDEMRLMILKARGEATPIATTDANGLFTVPDRHEGERVDLWATMDGYAEAGLPGVEAPTYQPVTLRLRRASKVRGTVVDASGRGVPGARVYGRVESPESSLMRSSQRGSDTSTDDDGVFILEGLSSGALSVTAQAEGYQGATLNHLTVEPEKDLEGVRIELERGAVLTGRITDPSGRPVSNANVMLHSLGNRHGMEITGHGVSDGEGRYRVDNAAPGRQSLEVHHEKYQTITRQIDLELSENTLDLSFEGGATLSGRVLEEAGQPVAGALIEVFSTSGHHFGGQERMSDTTGAFEVTGLPEGTFTVRAHKQGLAPAAITDLDVGPAGVSGLEITLAPGADVVGRLLGVEPNDYSRVEIYASGESGQFARGRTRTDGTYRVSDLSPGTYNVVASLGGQSATGEVVVASGAREVVLDLELERGLTVTGLLLKGSEPMAGAQVSVSGLDISSHGGATSDRLGHFEIRGLQPGRHTVQVSNYNTGLHHHEELELSYDREIEIRVSAARVSGTVIDETDLSPIVGAAVLLERQGTQPNYLPFVNSPQATDSAGHFRFAEASAGEYRIVASKHGYATAETTLTVSDRLDREGLEIRLTPTEGTRVYVTLSNGQPAGEFWAAVLDPSGRPLVTSSHYADADEGAFIGIPPGSWELLVGTYSSAVSSISIQVPTEPISIQLPDAAVVQVRIQALEGDTTLATVRAIGVDGRPYRGIQWMRSRQDPQMFLGQPQTLGLAPGAWTIQVEANDGRVWQGQVSLVAGENPELVLQ